MSAAADVDRLTTRMTLGATALSLSVAVSSALDVSSEHRLISGSGALAITLLLFALACSPAATWLAPKRVELAVALRRARRSLGVLAMLAALSHATLGMVGYLGSLDLGPILTVPWLRDGGLALLILVALGLTSFPIVTRTLHVRAWSALHRLVYASALLAALHATGAPFGEAWVGITTLLVVLALLLARPIVHAIALRRAARPGRNAT